MSRVVLWVLASSAVIGVVAVGTFAAVLSHNAPCSAAPPLAADTPKMKAMRYRCYGGPEVLRLEETSQPTLADNQVLVKVHTASVNPLDHHYLHGSPYIMRMESGIGAPKDTRMGVDFAGTVVQAGSKVTRFKAGDEVFGGADGAFGEYVAVSETGAIALKPPEVPIEQAAGVTIAGLTALQALRDHGQIHAGDKVLINGASGGVGSFAVQLAKSFGAEVTGVCSTRNVERVRALGADHVIDYRKEDFTQGTQRYDLIVDNVGNHTFFQYSRVLQPKGRFVIIGGPPGNWIGPLIGPLKATLMKPVLKHPFVNFYARLNAQDLSMLAGLMQAGRLKTVIDRHYPLSQVPAAIAYVESGHAQGKVLIDVE